MSLTQSSESARHLHGLRVREHWIVSLLALGVMLLLAERALYHVRYLACSPFARVTFSDGQVYEDAARDILAHPPLGSAPLFLQGAYAYLVALGLWPRGVLGDALFLQLCVCALALYAFARSAHAFFGMRGALVCAIALLSNTALAFYENKYLSAALGIASDIAVVAAYSGARTRPSAARAALLGACSGLSILARPNLLLALPFTGWALWHTAPDRRGARRLLACAAIGCSLSLAPLATRNLLVIGRASVFPSHGGGIPFYIGNHPGANGLWNNAGGLISGQVLLEREELAERLALDPKAPDIDQRIGNELYGRALEFMRTEPLQWLALEAKKLWYALGNQELMHDYDLLGERELLGNRWPVRLPFGLILGVGLFGLYVLARSTPDERRLCVVLTGQLLAVLTANLLWFTSAQNRLPLVVPLAFATAPALQRIRVRGPTLVAAISCTLLTAQAFIPRKPQEHPSAAHYYNLANAEEILGWNGPALRHYERAAQLRPKEPMFWLRLAHLARKAHQSKQADAALHELERIPLPTDLAHAVQHERALLDAR